MEIIKRLASYEDRKDQALNIALAQEIAANSNNEAVKELVHLLEYEKKIIRHDVIKTLYELGEIAPELIQEHIAVFIALLDNNDNRMQWGAMTAISTIAGLKKKEVFNIIGKLASVADSGSVITRDRYIKTLTSIGSDNEYNEDCFLLIKEQLYNCPENQLPMYSELAFTIINTPIQKNNLKEVIQNRLPDIISASKQKRLEKLIKKLQ